MTSIVDISMFDNEAEVLMVLFNAAGVGPTMSLEEATEELTVPRYIIMLHGRTMRLNFDGSAMLDCTTYDEVNKYPGYAQEVLDRHRLNKSQQLASIG